MRLLIRRDWNAFPAGMPLPCEALVSAKKSDVSFVAKDCEKTLRRRRLRESESLSTRRGVPVRWDSQRKSLEF